MNWNDGIVEYCPAQRDAAYPYVIIERQSNGIVEKWNIEPRIVIGKEWHTDDTCAPRATSTYKIF